MTAKTEAATPEVETEEPVEATMEDTDSRAARVVRHNMYWAAGAGLVPWPLVDTAALLGVQLKMLKELGDVYGVPFSANAGKSAVAALLGTVTGSASGHAVAGTRFMRLMRLRMPVIGTVLGIVTVPVFNAAFTYAVGKVFNKHFASGGTFLSFKAKDVQAEMQDAFEEGKEKAKAAASNVASAATGGAAAGKTATA